MKKQVQRLQRLQHLLLPAATVLVVLAAAFLPRQLSALRDQGLLSGAHTEAFDGSAGFSSSSLLESLRLLAATDGSGVAGDIGDIGDDDAIGDGDGSGGNVETFRQEIVHSDRIEALTEQIRAEALRLTEEKILPQEILRMMESAEIVNVNLIYLRSQATLSGASIITMDCHNEKADSFLYISLDEQSGKLLDLLYFDPARKLSGGGLSMKEAGPIFLEGLGLSGEYQSNNGDGEIEGEGNSSSASYKVEGSDLVYHFTNSDYVFEIYVT